MVFEATVQERNLLHARLLGSAKMLPILAVGIVVGLLLAETSLKTAIDADLFTTGEIIGEDWHGNVRRSSPTQ